MRLAYFRVRCLSLDSWSGVVAGRSDSLIVRRPVPPMARFRVYFGKKRLHGMDDCRYVFSCRGCERLGWGRYLVRVRIVRPRTVI